MASVAAGKPKLNWQGKDVQGLAADVCQVQSTREEAVLLFGTREPQAAGGKEPRAKLRSRIVLSPATAKRLSGALGAAVRNYEARFGLVDAHPTDSVSAADAAGAEKLVPAGGLPLLGLVQELKVDFGIERSFKMAPGRLSGDRLILAVRKGSVTPQALLGICRRVSMPPAHQALFEQGLAEANTVGFAFEGGERGGAWKVYLEYWDALRERVRREPGNREPALLYLGFKWEARDPARAVVARYTCHPLLAAKGIVRRLSALYGGNDDSPSLRATRAVLELASRKLAGGPFVYVEVAEEGTQRKSFDINFYRAALRVRELRSALAELCGRHAIAEAELERVIEQSGACAFGHLSGGVGRDGADFLTVYFEVQAL